MAAKVVTIALAEFAADHGVSLRTITNWLTDGMPHRNLKGERRIVRAEANRWVLDRERERVKSETAPDEARERARKLQFEADLKELELKERRLELVPMDTHRERIESIIGGFSAVAAGQLQRFERRIVQAADAAEARRITTSIHQALMEGAREHADELATQAEALEAAESVEAA